MKKIFVLFLCFIPSLMASEFELSMPVYAGSGCEPGSGILFFGSGNKKSYLGTPKYLVNSGERKTCMMVFPVKAAAGQRVAIASVQFKTESVLGENGSAVLQAEMFMAGIRAPVMTRVWDGPYAQEELFRLAPEPEKLAWSGCGQSANLRLNTNLIVTDGSVQVVSLRVRLKTSPC